MKIKTLLISFLLIGSFTAATAQDSASVVLDRAFAQAKKENKKVFIMFHASWCGWCKKMEKNMQDPAIKKYFDDNYITAFLTVQESPKNKSLENPGAAELLSKYKAQNSGIPFWVILDADGNMLENAFNSDGQNLGCPASTEEVAEFTAKLKKTSKLNDTQLAAISKVFVIKK